LHLDSPGAVTPGTVTPGAAMLRAQLLQIDGQVEQQALFGVTDLHPECSAELDARLRVRLGLRRLSSSCQALPHGPSQRPADAASRPALKPSLRRAFQARS